MAGFPTPRQDEVTSEINVLPLIDVLLSLLIICFVMRGILTWIPALIPAPAPPAAEAGEARPSRQVVLQLRADGTIAINHQPVPFRGLEPALHAIYDARPTKVLFIQAADERPYDEVIQLMDVARGVGVEVLAWMPR